MSIVKNPRFYFFYITSSKYVLSFLKVWKKQSILLKKCLRFFLKNLPIYALFQIKLYKKSIHVYVTYKNQCWINIFRINSYIDLSPYMLWKWIYYVKSHFGIFLFFRNWIILILASASGILFYLVSINLYFLFSTHWSW